MINLQELISKDAPISGKLRIHYSLYPFDAMGEKAASNGIDEKPRGLWYGFGREWIDYVEGNEDLKRENSHDPKGIGVFRRLGL